ncbi:MAG: phenylalanine--tRNA ligase subunit beta [Mycoplasmoidaceae bacterium]|nr:MAG: phenylalanine--tRNA ligase subunit beta [Mycoplasmoidaceae bacterium]
MIYSRKLLETFLPKLKDVSDEELSAAVGSTGNELPLKDIFHHPKLNNLVIGRIISFEKHKNSDHLNVCKVQIDKKGTINTIVCGAPNVTANKNVVVALKGAKLHDGRVIEYKDVRGIVSQGMLCGYYELTPLNADYVSPSDADGIMLFDDGEIGDTKVAQFLGLDDTLYEIEVPFANRNDPNGALSFIQDLAGFFKWTFKYPEAKFETKYLGLRNLVGYDKKVCNGFALAKIENWKMKDSNWSMKGLLMNNRFKPLNNLLDNLSYITLLTNVPTAAYDIGDSNLSINVELAKKGEKFIGFNSKEYNLSANDIVVKNKKEIICLAGILGDKNHGVSNSTKTAYIELANFNFVNIRNTASKYNIMTDAAKRNSKAITKFSTLVAASMLQKFFSKNNLKYNLNIKVEDIKPIKLDINKINEYIGSNQSANSIISHLNGLGFSAINNKTAVASPRYRTDVTTNADLAEEVIKSMDVNVIPEETIDISGLSENKFTEYYFINRIWNVLTNNYFFETKSYNMTSKQNVDKFNVFGYDDNVDILSPNNSNREVMRNNLIHSMLNVYKYNLARKNELVPIFETQKIYQNAKKGIKNVTFLSTQELCLDNINKSTIVYNVNGLKNIVDKLTAIFNAKVSYKPAVNKFFYDNDCVEILFDKKVIGYIGAIKKALLSDYSIKENIYAATLNWDSLYSAYKSTPFKVTPISNLMPIVKDLTFISSTYMNNAIDEISQLEYVLNIEFIGKFTKDDVVSYTIRFTLANREKITNIEIDQYMSKIIGIFAQHGINIKK